MFRGIAGRFAEMPGAAWNAVRHTERPCNSVEPGTPQKNNPGGGPVTGEHSSGNNT